MPLVFLQLALETLVQAYGRNVSMLTGRRCSDLYTGRKQWGLCAYAMIVMSEKIKKTQKNGRCAQGLGKEEFSEVRLIEVFV